MLKVPHIHVSLSEFNRLTPFRLLVVLSIRLLVVVELEATINKHASGIPDSMKHAVGINS